MGSKVLPINVTCLRPHLLVLLMLVPMLCGLSTRSASGAPQSFVEDFTTTVFRDSLNTTAWWDTAEGEAKLFPLPRIVGNLNTTGFFAQAVAVAGDYAFVADQDFNVVDISDPSAPTLVTTLAVGTPTGIDVAGDLAYVSDSNGNLVVVDIQDPANPVLHGSVPAVGIPYDVDVEGDWAYVADLFGLEVIDVSDPTNSTGVGSANIGDGSSVHVDGDYAYLAAGTLGLQVIDVSDPTTPVVVGIGATPDRATGVFAVGKYAYVADAVGLQVFDVTDPTTPNLVGSVATPAFPQDVRVSGNLAYVTDGTGLQVIDITDPTQPVLTASVDTPDFAYRLTIDGEHAFVTDGDAGLQVIEICQIVEAEFTWRRFHRGSQPLFVAGRHAYVAGRDNSSNPDLRIWDISDPDQPLLAGALEVSEIIRALFVSGDYLYAAASPGLSVIDVSDPASPVPVGSITFEQFPQAIFVEGDYAFVTGNQVLYVIDISDPPNPTLAGSVATTNSLSQIRVAGDYAYGTDFGGLSIFDITDPTAPALVGSVASPGSAQDVRVAGDYAYVANGSAGLQVIDVSDPSSPVVAGGLDTGSAQSVDVAGNHLYVGDEIVGGLVTLDITDPTSPTLIGTLSLGSAIQDVHAVVIDGGFAYATTDEDDGGEYFNGVRVAQHQFDSTRDRTQSLEVDLSDDLIVRARLAVVESTPLLWEITANGGISWQTLPADASWTQIDVPGNDLRWRSKHVLTDTEVNPSVSELTIDWLNEFARISSIEDVGNDQGRQVRINWTRSGHDFLGDGSQILEYSIYRRIDGEAQIIAPSSVGFEESSLGDPLNPPGWDFVLTVPADAEEEYSVVAPTLVDSTEADGVQWSVFMVRARVSAGVFFDSPPDSGYSIDNLEPGVPQNLVFDGPDVLAWDEATEEDFDHHSVYGSDDPVFDETAVLIGYTVEPTYDISSDPYGYYHVTTSDHVGNESEAATIENPTVSTPDGRAMPTVFALHAARPNPFRVGSSVVFDLPEARVVRLSIFDASGRHVRDLIAGHQYAGSHRVVWDAANDAGRRVAPGIYFARITAGNFEASRRLVVLR